MQNHLIFQADEIVRITNGNGYLTATQEPKYYKDGIFGIKKQIGDMVVLSNTPCKFNLWKLVKFHGTSNIIRYGDLIYLQNAITKKILIIDKNKNHHDFKLVYLSEIPKNPLVIQKSKNTKNIFKSIGDKPFRLVETDDIIYLKASAKPLQNSAQLHDIIGCSQPSDQDLWKFEKVQDEDVSACNIKLVKMDSLPQIPPIEDQNIIQLRNIWNGFSLHSHDIYYKTSKTQEVTGMCLPRDKNDDWIIYKLDNSEKQINDGDIVQLRHMATNKFLKANQSYTSYSQIGIQVTCQQNPNDCCLMVETIDHGVLQVEKPFYLKDPIRKVYLAQISSRSEVCGHQLETSFVKSKCTNSLWMIDQREKL